MTTPRPPMRASRCRDCRTVTILWAWTTNGRRVGLHPTPVDDHSRARFILIDTPSGFTLALTVRDDDTRRKAQDAGVKLYVAHRDVCEDAPASTDWRDR